MNLRSLAIGSLLACAVAARVEARGALPVPDDHGLYAAAFAAAEEGQVERARGLAARGSYPALVKVVPG